jgi:hypothetical protein
MDTDIQQHKCYNNTEYEVLTDEGFKDFKGIIAGNNATKLIITFSDGNYLKCTPKQKIFVTKEKYVFAEDLKTGDIIENSTVVEYIDKVQDDELVYDLLEVSDNHRYYANKILCHQCLLLDECAFIEPESILEDFWRSVFPTLSRSKKSKVLIASTPNGTGNLFHRLYEGSEKEENGFVTEKVPWYDVPGRDEKWKDEQIRALGSMDSFLQEYEIQFLSNSGSIDEELFYRLSQKCIDAPIILEEGCYRIWEEPSSEKIYVAGVDISEGVGIDASVIQIFDITDIKHIKQVATYHNRNIPPREFTNVLHNILKNWGSPLALIERNNCGAQVVDRLVFDLGYEKAVSYGAKIANRANPQMGMIAHTNTKYKGVTNMRYFVNEIQVVEFRDIETLKEMKDFVRHSNGTWKAKNGSHDDRVMATLYALFILEKEITERYFDVLELDDYGKPCAIEPMDFGVAMFENPTSIYTDHQVIGEHNSFVTPMIFASSDDTPDEIYDLQNDGWEQLH